MEHTELLKLLASAPADQRESCRSTAGDCLLQVAESRGRLVSSLRMSSCEEAPDAEARSSCFSNQLEGGGHTRELTAYFSLENWCFKQLTSCTQTKAEEARIAALDTRFITRKQAMEAAPEARAARSAVLLGRARVEYLRASLPPDASICQRDAAFESCHARVEADRHALDERLHQDDQDATATSSSYVAIEQAEASCGQPELDCLSSSLSSYGVYPESRKWVERNLALLAERQQLLSSVDDEGRDRCIAQAQGQQQAEIVSAYVAYVRQPVLYFRVQLDKSFLALHQAEVSCLGATRKRQPAAQAVAATR